MSKKVSKLKFAQAQTEAAIKKTNERIVNLGSNSEIIYNSLGDLQTQFDLIRNVPTEHRVKYQQLKEERLEWKQQAEKIAADYKTAEIKNASKGAAGIGAGIAVAALGPTAAMGVATTFGVASTGTAISALSGAAATNAALAWLGGGALAAGGGGMAAGNALLALAGPVGWAIAGVAILGSGIMFLKSAKDQQRLEEIYTLISKRDTTKYELAIVELNERIERIKKENNLLCIALTKVKSFGLDYQVMTEAQQYELGSYVNLMESSTQLLINPIMGLLPSYSNEDFKTYVALGRNSSQTEILKKSETLITALANLLFKITLDEKDKALFGKSLKRNKKFLDSVDASKKEFDDKMLETVFDALEYKYST